MNWLLSLLALKLTRTRRVSHVDDLLSDPAAGLFAGVAVLPKKTVLTDYSVPGGIGSGIRACTGMKRAPLRTAVAGCRSGKHAVWQADRHNRRQSGSPPRRR